MTLIYIIIGVMLAAASWLVRHQRRLRLRAHLMEEAIRNRDFSFRLPTNGLLPGERAMQQTLNRLGETIHQQVMRNEVESWERLSRVLTHEIMNATAPIASISQSLLSRPDVKGGPLEEGVRAIHTASDHLGAFVDNYRKMSQLQQPQLEEVDLATLIADAGDLFPTLERRVETVRTVAVTADTGMLRQILINMMKNAQEAGATIVTFRIDGQQLYVGNNGQPIAAANRSSVFVPFFTTKQKGSGIGLSLSRRMMVSQGGMLELCEQPLQGDHVTFLITLPAA